MTATAAEIKKGRKFDQVLEGARLRVDHVGEARRSDPAAQGLPGLPVRRAVLGGPVGDLEVDGHGPVGTHGRDPHELHEIRSVVLAVAVGGAQAGLATHEPAAGAGVVSVEGDRGGVVVQILEAHTELPDHVDDELGEQRLAIGIEEPIEAAPHPIVLEPAAHRPGEAELGRDARGGPLAQGIERDAGQGEVAHEDAEGLARREAGAGVRARQEAVEQRRDAQAFEHAIDRGQRPDLPGVELEGRGLRQWLALLVS